MMEIDALPTEATTSSSWRAPGVSMGSTLCGPGMGASEDTTSLPLPTSAAQDATLANGGTDDVAKSSPGQSEVASTNTFSDETTTTPTPVDAIGHAHGASPPRDATAAVEDQGVIDLTDDANFIPTALGDLVQPQRNAATKRKRASDDDAVTASSSKKHSPPTPAKAMAKIGAIATPSKVATPANVVKSSKPASATPSKAKPAMKTPQKSMIASAVAASPATIATPQQRPTPNTISGPLAPAPVTPTHQRLRDIPALSPRYQKSYISPVSSTPLRSPTTFSIKPPYWKRWPTSMYTDLAQEFRRQFDAEPFARAHNKSVEEVEHIFHALIYEPMQSQAEKVRKVCEARVEKRMKALNEYGEQMRKWEIGGKRIRAELYGVKEGVVVFIGEKGEEFETVFGQLGTADREYVKDLASDEDLAKLTGGME